MYLRLVISFFHKQLLISCNVYLLPPLFLNSEPILLIPFVFPVIQRIILFEQVCRYPIELLKIDDLATRPAPFYPISLVMELEQLLQGHFIVAAVIVLELLWHQAQSCDFIEDPPIILTVFRVPLRQNVPLQINLNCLLVLLSVLLDCSV